MPVGMAQTSPGSDPFQHLSGFSDCDRREHASNGPRFVRYFLPEDAETSTSTAPRYDAPDGRRWVKETVVQRVREGELCSTNVPDTGAVTSNTTAPHSSADGLATAFGLQKEFVQYNPSRTSIQDFMSWLEDDTENVLEPQPQPEPLKQISPSSVQEVLQQLYPHLMVSQDVDALRRFLRASYKKPVEQTHANFVNVFAAFESQSGCVDVFTKKEDFTLQSALQFNRDVFRSFSDVSKRFVVFQLLSAVAFLHEHRIAHGNIRPQTAFVSPRLWIKLALPFHAHHRRSVEPRIPRWRGKSVIQQWVDGDISNFEYLMILNRAAGRSMIDASFHAMMPWVVDFSDPHEGWRDLR